jgi:GT2 family glycosyltransferase
MPKVLYPDGSIQYLCRLLPGPIDLIARRFVPIFARRLLKARAARYELRNKSYDTTLLVPHLSGCFMLMSANALKKVGLFDERFFMYLEDVDLSRRMHRQFLTIYYPRVFIFHEFAKGSYSSWKLLSHHVFSAIRFFNKWGWLDRERSEVNSATLTQNEPRLRPIMPTKPSERETHLTPSS